MIGATVEWITAAEVASIEAEVTIGWLKTWASGVNGARTIGHQL